MRLIIGGYAQGKLAYAKKQMEKEGKQEILVLEGQDLFHPSLHGHPLPDPKAFCGSTSAVTQADVKENLPEAVIINHLHLYIRKFHSREEALDGILSLISQYEEMEAEVLVLCDELGCGIVPAVQEERDWRENTGRILCVLAARAQTVTRLFCGIAQKLK